MEIASSQNAIAVAESPPYGECPMILRRIKTPAKMMQSPKLSIDNSADDRHGIYQQPKYPAVIPLRISDMDTQSEFNSVGLFDGRYRSFLETMNELRPSLHRYCARMTGSVMDGEDIVQEALFEAYRKLDQYDESRPLKPWLFRIAHNRSIDFLRRKGVRDEAEAAAAMPEAVSPAEPATLGIGKAVKHLVASLPPKERACILLKDVFDYSLEEIVELVDSTVGGVK